MIVKLIRLPVKIQGFTLIEVMVAMVITMVGLLGLLQSVNIATEHNLKNQLRDEAGKVADEQLRYMLNTPIANLSTSRRVQSSINGLKMNYVINLESRSIPPSNAREMKIKVGWLYKNVSSHYELRSLKSE